MRRSFALICALALAPAHASGDLGRLFFTPAERARLERGDTPRPPAPPQLNGVVQKHQGARTIWLDGVARDASGDSPASQPIELAEHGKLQLTVGARTHADR